MNEQEDGLDDSREQVNQAIEFVAALVDEMPAPREFYEAFLNRFMPSVDAEAGAVWLVKKDAGLKRLCHVNMEDWLPDINTGEHEKHNALLRLVRAQAKPYLLRPYENLPISEGTTEASGNASGCYAIFVPLMAGSTVDGVLEIYLHCLSSPVSVEGKFLFFKKVAELANRFSEKRHEKKPASGFLSLLERFRFRSA